ncbi:cation transporting ATPase C-terminal domain-containing protein [Streptomyces sp. NBC_01262]
MFRIELLSNPWLIAAGCFGIALMAAISYLPALQAVFNAAPLDAADWAASAAQRSRAPESSTRTCSSPSPRGTTTTRQRADGQGDLPGPIVLARIYDLRRADIYRELGIPTIASVRWTVHQMLLHRHLTPELTFGNGETLLVRSHLPAYVTGRRLTAFDVDGEIRVVEVTRAGRSLMPAHNTPVEPGDLVTFAVAATALGRLRGFLD